MHCKKNDVFTVMDVLALYSTRVVELYSNEFREPSEHKIISDILGYKYFKTIEIQFFSWCKNVIPTKLTEYGYSQLVDMVIYSIRYKSEENLTQEKCCTV